MKLSQIQIDSAAIEQGAWRPAVGLTGVEFRVRGIGNADYEALADKLRRHLPPAAKFAEKLPADEAARMTVELLVDACLLDWRGLEDEAGEPLPYSADKARALLSDPDFRKLRDSVFATAARLAEETVAEREAASGN